MELQEHGVFERKPIVMSVSDAIDRYDLESWTVMGRRFLRQLSDFNRRYWKRSDLRRSSPLPFYQHDPKKRSERSNVLILRKGGCGIRKKTGDKAENNVWCDLPPKAMAVIARQPKTAPEIFPYTAIAITASFTRACKIVEIEDLHFHNLRREGASRLFVMEQVATAHRL